MSKTKIIWLSIAGALVVATALALTFYFTLRPAAEIIDVNLSVSQVGQEQSVLVEWETSTNVDQVVINVKDSKNVIKESQTINSPSLIAKGNATVNASYGKQIVEVVVKKNNGATSSKSQSVDVFADEYVIAPLVATMPVTFFSLNLKEYTNNYSIPTFVWLQRGGAWNYSNLHENVYLMPMGEYSEMSTYTDPVKMYEETSKWVKELYEINPNSKFHLYYNDYHPWGWMQATVANNIPTENYDVTLLSDGTGSYYAFSKYMCQSNSDELFAQMCEKYNKLKEQISAKGSYTHYDTNVEIDTSELRHYIFCMLTEEPNVKLVLARDFVKNDMPKDNPMRETFLGLIANAENPNRPINVYSLYSLLNNLSSDEKVELKSLYKFSDNMFEKANEEGKKIMVILGTRTDLETNFDYLVKATMAYYGNEYVYYYKGHPGTPTQMDSAKMERLNNLGLIDVDSTISAELIFFFNPEIYATGYSSTTYVSLTDEQVKGIWNVKLSNVNTEYKEKVDYTITKLSESDSVYGLLAVNSNCFLFEFKDTTNYDCAVYDAEANLIRYYKNNGSEFEEVNA